MGSEISGLGRTIGVETFCDIHLHFNFARTGYV
jgi:hypothetical protein